MEPERIDLESAMHDVLTGRAGRKKPSTVAELQMIVAEVIDERSSNHARGWTPITSGGLSEKSLPQFVAILEELQKEGFLETRWRAGDFQDAAFTITEKYRRRQQGGDEHDPIPIPIALPEQKTSTPPSGDSRNVFVVDGRNNAAREALFTFLRAIGLHPLEWSEIVQATGKASPYIGEVLDRRFSMAQAVVVLLTPDDEAQLREPYWRPSDPYYETHLTPQPRPNVLVEAGMALGLFPERTVIVEIGELRPVGDIGGRQVIRMNDTAEKRHELAQRLKTAGCATNLSGTDWYKAGVFSSLPE